MKKQLLAITISTALMSPVFGDVYRCMPDSGVPLFTNEPCGEKIHIKPLNSADPISKRSYIFLEKRRLEREDTKQRRRDELKLKRVEKKEQQRWEEKKRQHDELVKALKYRQESEFRIPWAVRPPGYTVETHGGVTRVRPLR